MRTIIVAALLAMARIGSAHAQDECVGAANAAASMGSDVVCCSIGDQSRWTTHAACDRLLNQSQACFRQYQTTLDIAAGRCVQPDPPQSPAERQRELLQNAVRVEICSSKVSVIMHAVAFKVAGYDADFAFQNVLAQARPFPDGLVYIRAWVAEVYRTDRYTQQMDIHPIYDDCMRALERSAR